MFVPPFDFGFLLRWLGTWGTAIYLRPAPSDEIRFLAPRVRTEPEQVRVLHRVQQHHYESVQALPRLAKLLGASEHHQLGLFVQGRCFSPTLLQIGLD